MTDRPSILVPVRVLEGESLPEGVPDLLADAHVVLLGYHVIPDQTATGQARLQFEERANRRLDEFEEILTDAGATVERRLVFTHDGQQTIDRLIYEHDCLAVLAPNATRGVEDILVAVRGTVGTDRLTRTVAGLFGDRDVTVTLYHIAGEGESDADAQTLLDGLVERLVSLGMDEDSVETRVERTNAVLDTIIEAADDYDAVVMGESDPSLTTFVFGLPADQVADRFLGPVFVVQRERQTDDEEKEDEEGEDDGGDEAA
ncbi:universal stress protein [Halobacterium rubrum]|uniref:universal stress protein n=1 Tax=Halobacterium TaxID=2239 RepID=UPI001F333B05|nr:MULTISPECIES: universal stress protein [Halobacterium]MDH5019588.1 universal stress protein [Halobacterium rubrum]